MSSAAPDTATPVLSLKDRTPVYSALAESHVLAITAETTPDEKRPRLLKLAQLLTGADPLVRALARDEAVAHLRLIGTVEPGRIVEAAFQCCNGATPLSVGVTCSNGIRLYMAEDLLHDEGLAGDTPWLIEGYLVRGVNILYGAPKVGKGTLALHLARAVAAGEPCLGGAVKAGPVLWLDLEQGRRLMRRKLAEANAGGLAHPFHVYTGPLVTLEAVEEAVQRTAPALVVIDSLARFLLLENENDNAELTRKMAPVVDFAMRRDVCLLPIHHDRKSGGEHGAGMRGGSALAAVCDVALHLKREPGDEDSPLRRIETVSRHDEANGRKLVIQRTAPGTYELIGSPAERRRLNVLDALGADTLDLEAWAERLKLTRQALEADARALHAQGFLSRSGSGRKGDPFRFSRMEK